MIEFIQNLDGAAATLLTGVFTALSASVAAYVSVQAAVKSTRTQNANNSTVQISQFRQEWISTLRDTMSEFQAKGTVVGNDLSSDVEFYRLGTKIELLMNRQDPEFEDLQSAMYNYLSAAEMEQADKYALNSRYVEICQRILKREWEVLKVELKKGEIRL